MKKHLAFLVTVVCASALSAVYGIGAWALGTLMMVSGILYIELEK